MEIVQKEGERQVKRTQTFYNLDAIISVGYRVNSTKATQFRIWATKTLKNYLSKIAKYQLRFLTRLNILNLDKASTNRSLCFIINEGCFNAV